jgi:cyclopropane-fatty-acyl-phospholipid synthase
MNTSLKLTHRRPTNIRGTTLPMRLLAHLLNRFIRNGILRLIAADGTLRTFGGPGQGPTVTARLHDPRLYTKLFFNPELHAGEAYMNSTLTFEDDSDVGGFMELFAVNRGSLAAPPGQALLRRRPALVPS